MAAKRSARGGGAAKPARSALAAIRDGEPLDEEEARSIWKLFSEYMDTHQGDLAGFARLHGYASVSPEYRRGQAVLVLRTSKIEDPRDETP